MVASMKYFLWYGCIALLFLTALSLNSITVIALPDTPTPSPTSTLILKPCYHIAGRGCWLTLRNLHKNVNGMSSRYLVIALSNEARVTHLFINGPNGGRAFYETVLQDETHLYNLADIITVTGPLPDGWIGRVDLSAGSLFGVSVLSDSTPEPALTDTPAPMITPISGPHPTSTQYSTYTPRPTYTPYPTYTPHPTFTPLAQPDRLLVRYLPLVERIAMAIPTNTMEPYPPPGTGLPPVVTKPPHPTSVARP